MSGRPYYEQLRVDTRITIAAEVYVPIMRGIHIAV